MHFAVIIAILAEHRNSNYGMSPIRKRDANAGASQNRSMADPAFAGMLVESLPLKIDDNLTVPVLTGLVLSIIV